MLEKWNLILEDKHRRKNSHVNEHKLETRELVPS